MAADTDGTDGGRGRPDDPAGAFIDETTLTRARSAGLDPAAFLADNNSTGFFNGIGDLFVPGPTFTNVTDFRAIVVDTPGVVTGNLNGNMRRGDLRTMAHDWRRGPRC